MMMIVIIITFIVIMIMVITKVSVHIVNSVYLCISQFYPCNLMAVAIGHHFN